MNTHQERRECFEQCVQTYSEALYRTAFRLLGQETLARELVQESYFQAWKNLDSLKALPKMKSWLFSILRFQYTKLLTKEKKHRAESLEQVAVRVASPEPKANEEIQEAIGRLEEKNRLPLLLVLMEGFSVSEAAEILEIPRGTVLSRIHRAKQKLKLLLASAEEPKI